MKKVYYSMSIVLLVLLIIQFGNFTAIFAQVENEDKFQVKYDFGTEDSPVAEGYEKVTHKTLYSEETAFGLDKEIDSRDRENEENKILRDFVFGSDGYLFTVDLPNGDYWITIYAGDADATNTETEVTVNDAYLGSMSSGQGDYDVITQLIEITDEKMIFDMSGSNARINAIELIEADPVDLEPVENVKLTDHDHSVTLENSEISINVNKSTTRISSIFYKNGNEPEFNLVGGQNGGGSYLANYKVGDESFQRTISNAEFKIINETPERIEIAMIVDDADELPYYLEVRMALEKDSSGFYYYTIYKYTDDMPDDLGLNQLRYAFALGDSSFEYFVVDDERGVQQRPTHEDLANSIPIQDSTDLLPGPGLPEGRVYSKYQNISNLEGNNNVFMASNGEVGVSLIQASKEYFDGGPTKQELTTHDYYDGQILLWHEHSGHYGTPDIQPKKGWEKIYGPFYLYVNESTGTDAEENVKEMWNDAKRKAEEEKNKWPYKWISDPIYAVEERSDVSGRLEITDGSSPHNAWVILSDPKIDWQEQTEDYVYYTQADSSGNFNLSAVRPGIYKLTAFVDGVMDEYTLDNIKVESNKPVNLNKISWTPTSYGDIIWQIGIPNRSAEEFFIYGGKNGFRDHLTWLEYPYIFPDGVDFKIGESDFSKDWNYFQPMYQTPGTPSQLELRGTKEDKSLTEWKIRFDSDSYKEGTATLSINLASSVFGTLEVKLNGETVSTFKEFPGPPGDAASYRQGIRGIYRQLDPIQFDAAKIKAGENIITLSPYVPPEAPTSDDWMNPMAAIMYDVIRLEVDSDTEVDLTEELTELISEAKEISNADGLYTERSFEALQQAIELAEASIETIDSEASLITAVEALRLAIEGLVKIDPIPDLEVDVSKLEKLITKAKSYSNEDRVYTADSFTTLQQATKAAEAALKTVHTEEELNAELALLQSAIAGLEKAKEDVKEEIVNSSPNISDGQAVISSNDIDRLAQDGQFIIDITVADEIEKIYLTSDQVRELINKNAEIIIKKSGIVLSIPTLHLNGDEDVTITIDRITEEAVTIPKGKELKGDIFKFTIMQKELVSEFTKENPVTLEFAVDENDITNINNLQVFYLNEETGEWLEIGGEYTGESLVVSTTHFSIFAPMETIALSDGPDPIIEESKEDKGGDENGDTDKDKDKDQDVTIPSNKDGDSLPKTATTMYMMLLIGLVLLVLGGASILVIKRKKIEQ